MYLTYQMLVNCHYENLLKVVIMLAPCVEHQEPLIKSNDVCMAPYLYFIIPKGNQKTDVMRIYKLKKKVYMKNYKCNVKKYSDKNDKDIMQ